MSEQPHDLEQHLRRFAQALGERQPKPLDHILPIVEVMGVEFADDPQREHHAEQFGEQAQIARKLVVEVLSERGIPPD